MRRDKLPPTHPLVRRRQQVERELEENTAEQDEERRQKIPAEPRKPLRGKRKK